MMFLVNLDTNRSLKTSEYLRETGQAFITLTDFSNMSFLKNKGERYPCEAEKGRGGLCLTVL